MLAALVMAGLVLLPAEAAPAPSSAAPLADGPAHPDSTACRLIPTPARIPVQDAAVLFTVGTSRDPGTLRGVEVEPSSGASVLKAAPAPGSEEVAARVAMNTSGATPGTWTLTLRGSRAACAGTIEVVERRRPGR